MPGQNKSKRNQQELQVKVDFRIDNEHTKDDKPLQEVFDIIMNHMNVSEMIKSGKG